MIFSKRFLIFLVSVFILPWHISSYAKKITKIDAPFLFYPTLDNLNTITLTNLSQQKSKFKFEKTTISDLAITICDHYSTLRNTMILPILINDQEDKKKYYRVYKGIKLTPSDDTTHNGKNIVTIYSRGFAREKRPIKPTENISLYRKLLSYVLPGYQKKGSPKKGGGVLCAYAALHDNLIHTPCITFDYPDTQNLTNFSQSIDLACLDTIIKNIPTSYQMIYMGTSRGATALLKQELLNTTNQHPCAMILESPFFSIKDTISQLTQSALYDLPFSSYLMYALFQWLCPRYKAQEDNLLQLLPSINPHVPILIIHLKGDPYVSNDGIFNIVHTLAEHNNNIHLLVLTDSTNQAHHGSLNKIKAVQQIVNAFFKQYAIPHDPTLAGKGKNLLSITRHNAYRASSPQKWILMSCF